MIVQRITEVALVDVYPTEMDAVLGIQRVTGNAPEAEYRGVWRAPTGAVVHLFSDVSADVLTVTGWSLAQPGDVSSGGTP
jgi:hypothetical protein